MARPARVCEVGELDEGEAARVGAEVTGTGDAIAVFHEDGLFYALGDTCTHAQASLSEGWAEDGEVECPMHAGRFCLKTGQALGTPVTVDAVTYPVEVRDGAVWLVLDAGEGR